MLSPSTLTGVLAGSSGIVQAQLQPVRIAPVGPPLPPVTTVAPNPPAGAQSPAPSTSEPSVSSPRGLPRGSLLDMSV